MLAGLVGQVGCVTGLVAVFIIAIAFGLGRFLDTQFGVNGYFTVGLMVASFPVTLYAMVRISLQMVARAQARVDQLDQQDHEVKQSNE